MQFTSPMTMMDYFRKSAGVWFSERTVHNFDTAADESGKSNIIIDLLDRDDPRILTICEERGVDPQQVSGGASFLWQDNLDDASPNPNYAAILVDVPDRDNPRLGKFLRNRGYIEGIPVIGLYHFANDGVLTIETEYEVNQGQERSWFINDHFRIRVMTVQLLDGVKQMAYCSERRCVLPDRLTQMLARDRVHV
jgi:hypothetical protein